jgi:hypothetical protein
MLFHLACSRTSLAPPSKDMHRIYVAGEGGGYWQNMQVETGKEAGGAAVRGCALCSDIRTTEAH